MSIPNINIESENNQIIPESLSIPVSHLTMTERSIEQLLAENQLLKSELVTTTVPIDHVIMMQHALERQLAESQLLRSELAATKKYATTTVQDIIDDRDKTELRYEKKLQCALSHLLSCQDSELRLKGDLAICQEENKTASRGLNKLEFSVRELLETVNITEPADTLWLDEDQDELHRSQVEFACDTTPAERIASIHASIKGVSSWAKPLQRKEKAAGVFTKVIFSNWQKAVEAAKKQEEITERLRASLKASEELAYTKQRQLDVNMEELSQVKTGWDYSEAELVTVKGKLTECEGVRKAQGEDIEFLDMRVEELAIAALQQRIETLYELSKADQSSLDDNGDYGLKGDSVVPTRLVPSSHVQTLANHFEKLSKIDPGMPIPKSTQADRIDMLNAEIAETQQARDDAIADAARCRSVIESALDLL